jgi:hypothetical protein
MSHGCQIATGFALAPPFGVLEVEAMSHAASPSTQAPYGVARVTAVWELARSSFYAAPQRQAHPREPRKRGPKVLSDPELVAEIQKLLAAPVFPGEGYRKMWARLRFQGVRTSKRARSAADARKPVALAGAPG